MSAELIWQIVRKNSCFLVKNQGLTLTKEPGNLTKLNTFKANGYVNNKSVGVEAAADGKGVVLSLRTKAAETNKPAKAVSSTTITKGSRAAIKSIRNVLNAGSYRRDLVDPAVRRASAILKSQKAGVSKKQKRSRRKKL